MPISKHLWGIGAMLLCALVTFLFCPLFVTPTGFVWILALAVMTARLPRWYSWAAGLAMAAIVFLLYGTGIGAMALLMVACALIGLHFALKPGTPAMQAGLTLFGALTAGIVACFVILRVFFGGIETIIEQVFTQLNEAMPEFMDEYLTMLGDMTGTKLALADIILVLQQEISITLPGDALTYCLYGAAFSVALGNGLASLKGSAIPGTEGYDLPHWMLPRFTGRGLALCALACYLLSLLGIPNLQVAANCFYALLAAAFTLQGMAYIAFIQKVKGSGLAWRITLPCLLFVFVRPVLMIFGVFDRLTPVRKLSAGVPFAQAFGIDIEKKDENDDGDDDQDDTNYFF